MHIRAWDNEQYKTEGLRAVMLGSNSLTDSMELMTKDTPLTLVRRFSPGYIILRAPSLWQIVILAKEGYEPPVLYGDDVVMSLDPLEPVRFPDLAPLLAMINQMGRGKFRKEQFSLYLSESQFSTLVFRNWIIKEGEDAYSLSIDLIRLYVQDAEDLLADRDADEIENGRMFNHV